MQVTCLKLRKELLILASTQAVNNDVLKAYKLRWGIERTFLCLKTKGFNFEDTHMTEEDKLMKLMAIASCSWKMYCDWCD